MATAIPRIAQAVAQAGWTAMHRNPAWLRVFQEGLRHEPYLLCAERDEAIVGLLPLAYVRSWLFGRFLVSLPYLNTCGVTATDACASNALVDEGVRLADRLDVRYLELRHEARLEHPSLGHELTSKVHMRRELPPTQEELWRQLDPKVRNQIRKAESCDLTVEWGESQFVPEFHRVFSRNMRDLGTPTFGRALFTAIVRNFPRQAEICLIRHKAKSVAAALIVHGHETTEVPSASSLRRFNGTNANMLMYWRLLCRAIEREQSTFDFGRSSPDSGTFRFKKQWGAAPEPAIWQYYVRRGTVADMRPDNPRFAQRIKMWRRLPVWLTRLAGPAIVRGIP